MQFQLSLRRLTLILVVILSLLAISSFGVQVGKYVYDYREDWTRMINMDREMNLPTWYEAGLMAFCGLLLGIIAKAKRSLKETEQPTSGGSHTRRFSRDWQLLSRISYLLAFDEIVGIHELFIIPELADKLRLPWFLHSTWVTPGLVAVAWFLQRFWRFGQHLDPTTQRWFIGALGVFLAGAIGMEMVGSTYAEWLHQQTLGYAVLATLEEILETLGLIALIYGLLDYLRRFHPEIDFSFKVNP